MTPNRFRVARNAPCPALALLSRLSADTGQIVLSRFLTMRTPWKAYQSPAELVVEVYNALENDLGHNGLSYPSHLLISVMQTLSAIKDFPVEAMELARFVIKTGIYLDILAESNRMGGSRA